ncbi:hypothetical protein ZHAS_00004896 [Anopheles sinensis]|uniref:Secreted protein n=1 Tax=Anopheles sinensis TaxID=74873 RepID=A0A084VI27_ANOSI|nr:hypothetical protein ZHAS_00004896 [Anopheles sinensis]
MPDRVLRLIVVVLVEGWSTVVAQGKVSSGAFVAFVLGVVETERMLRFVISSPWFGFVHRVGGDCGVVC